MTTVTSVIAGTSQTITLNPGDTLAVSTQPHAEGQVSVVRNGVSNSGGSTTTAATVSRFGPPAMSKTFGPYPLGALVTITCTVGSIDCAGGATVIPGAPQIFQATPAMAKITTANGRLMMGGKDYRGIGINAHDLFYDFLTTATVSAVTKANPGVVTTSAAHGWSVGDPVYVSGVGGMTQLAGNYVVNTTPSGSSLTLKNTPANGGAVVDTTAFTTFTTGGSIQRNWFTVDLPAIAAFGVKLIRASAGPVNATAVWAAQVGTNGATPVATYLPALRVFLDECWKNGIGVALSLFWSPQSIPLALSSTVADYLTPGSTTRVYMKALASSIAKTFVRHPALAAYSVGNEWFDLASIATFASTSSNTGLDHFGALVGTVNDVVAGVRAWDNDRSVISPSGSNGWFEGGTLQEYVRKMIAAAGTCDIVDTHVYPNTDVTGQQHAFVGLDLGGADVLLPSLRNACLESGKVLMVQELGGQLDSPAFGTAVGALSQVTYTKCFNAGVEVILDWSWYVSNAGQPPDLKTTRLAVMSLIAAKNATLIAGFKAPSAPYPSPLPVPTRCARSNGTASGIVTIPNHPDLSPDTVSTAKFARMFWLRKQAAIGTSPRLFDNYDGTNGMVLNLNSNEGLTLQTFWGGSNVSFTPTALTYPNNPTDPSFAFVGEWMHVAMLWDGTLNPASWGNNNQNFEFWLNGVEMGRLQTTGKTASAPSTRNLVLFGSSDGGSLYAQADMFDHMIGKNFALTSEMVKAYLLTGAVPAGMQHRWKLSGDGYDSIGNLNATLAAGVSFVANGIGST